MDYERLKTMTIFVILVILIWLIFCWLFISRADGAEEGWVCTAYCSCEKCCGKSDGITASGTKAHQGTVANNWLPFGTKLKIEGYTTIFTVEDRGSVKHFGTKTEKRKRLDIWFPSHKEALEFCIQRLKVIQ